jgi:hypothetical protein
MTSRTEKKKNFRRRKSPNEGRSDRAVERRLGFGNYIKGPVLKDHYSCIVKSVGYTAPAGATASTYEYIVVNSLLNTSSTTTKTPTYSAIVANVGKNYSSYRVTHARVTNQICSRAITNSFVVSGFVPEDPAPGAGATFDFSLATLPHVNYYLVPATTAVAPTMTDDMQSKKMIFRQLAGTDEVLTDDSYSGSSSTAGVFTTPAKPMYFFWHQGSQSLGAFVANQAPLSKFILEQWVVFYDRRL